MPPERKEIEHIPEKYEKLVKSSRNKDKTDRRELLSLDNYLEYVGTDYEQHNWETVQDWIKDCIGEKDHDREYVRQRYYHVNDFYEWLEKKEIITRNPCHKVDYDHFFKGISGENKKDDYAYDDLYYLTPDGIDKLIENVPAPEARNRLLIKLMYQTGVRAKEATEIRRDADRIDRGKRSIGLDRKNRSITLMTAKKRGKREPRTVYYKPTLDPFLDRWETARKSFKNAVDSPYLFPSRASEQMDPEAVNDVVRKAADKADIQNDLYEDSNGGERKQITSHCLRHSYAHSFMTSGGDIRTLQVLLGHSSIDITEKYLRWADDTYEDLARKHIPR